MASSLYRLHHHTQTQHPLGLLWMRDRPVAETSTWQYTTLTTDRQFEPAIPVSKRPLVLVYIYIYIYIYIKVKYYRYRPGVTKRLGRGIALLFHDRGTRRGWVVSSTPRPHFAPKERHGTHFTGDWVGSRAGLDGRKISSSPGFDPGPSSP